MPLHRSQQIEQLPPVSIGLGQPAGQHVVAVGGVAGPRGRRAELPQLGHRGEKTQPADDPLGLADQLEIGGAFAGLENLPLDAVVGAVAVGDVFVGGAEQVVFVVRLLFRLRPRIRRRIRRPIPSAAPPLPNAWAAMSKRGTCQYSSALASR